jgi:predicted transcriptional regulator
METIEQKELAENFEELIKHFAEQYHEEANKNLIIYLEHQLQKDITGDEYTFCEESGKKKAYQEVLNYLKS